MARTKHVEITSAEEKQGIVNTSVQALNTRVVGQAAEMKKRFVMPITNNDGEPSVTEVIDRVVRQTEAALDDVYETAKNLIHFASPDITFEKKFTLDAVEWEQDSVTKKWMLRVLKSMHNISNVRSVTVERYSTETGMYENILYAYKRYATTGTVALLFDEKIEVRIIIKGES